MRIAMFTETFLPNTDGIVTRLCATLQHLEKEGHDVLLFAPAGSPSEYAAAQVVTVPSFRFFLYPEKKFPMPWPVGRMLAQFRPDFIHVVNPAFVGLAGIWYAKRMRLPLIASYHTNVPTYARHYHLDFLEPVLWWYFRLLHNQAQINLCTSKATWALLEEHRFRNLGLWERGVDVALYQSARSSAAMRRRLARNMAEGDKILLYVGRLASEKAIERLRPVLDAESRVHLAIVGDGPYRPELERVFAGTNTVFTGYMHGKELAEAYASADGFVFPSTTETLGLVLFEAMASGLPVLAADSPPTREVLENGQAGFIFDAANVDDLIEGVRELLWNEPRRRAVLQRTRAIVENLDWSGPTEQLLAHYRRLFAEQPAVRSTPVRGSRL
ncbi:glycosyltransferase family 4 protein [Alicyclobacillus shizuokensis]|uniref:glycosyltransferase family 4 protein n=1 Tax=Alicyclobacillus shizuokensis TaxID=392014 RepID=UPI00082C1DA5|nr:glycosyltransferase family 1 protein [Alicyclobacillus shizuokensis]MCL6627453.1 glycosyltransferase family 1 protein [Alicyclobacillus shizuokensis]